MSHTFSIFSPVLRQLSRVCLFALFLERVYCADTVTVNATDPRIQYNPPLGDGINENKGWAIFDQDNSSPTWTNDASATASFNFSGSSFTLRSVTDDGSVFSTAVNVTFDGNVSTVTGQPISGDDPHIVFTMNDLDPSVQHNVSMRKSQTQDDGNGVWNIISMEFNLPSGIPLSVISLSLLPSSTSTTGPAQTSSPPPKVLKPPTGIIVVASVGACLSIGVICILSICLHPRQKRKRRDNMLTAEPIAGSEPRSQLMAEIRG